MCMQLYGCGVDCGGVVVVGGGKRGGWRECV